MDEFSREKMATLKASFGRTFGRTFGRSLGTMLDLKLGRKWLELGLEDK